MFLPVFHLSVVLINSFTIWYDQKYVNIPFTEKLEHHDLPLKKRMLFLTMWGLTIQTVFFIIAFLNDIFGTNERNPKKTSLLRNLKDAMFSLAFPVALYVFLAFWSIYFIDKNLIFPDFVAKIMPVWCNHVIHTCIVPFIITELLFSPRKYPSRKIGVSIIIAFTLCYVSYLNYVYQITGTFVYPVLDVLNWPVRIVFFSFSTLVGIGMYIIGENIDAVVNSFSVKAKRR